MTEAIIGFEEHRIRCIIGCCDHERMIDREILVDLKVHTDISACVKSDCIDDALSYVILADMCTEIAQEGKFFLLEAYANTVLEKIMSSFPVTKAWIKVKKPQAIPTAKWTLVQLEKVR